MEKGEGEKDKQKYEECHILLVTTSWESVGTESAMVGEYVDSFHFDRRACQRPDRFHWEPERRKDQLKKKEINWNVQTPTYMYMNLCL